MNARRLAALALGVALAACASGRVDVRPVREGVVFRYRGSADAVTMSGSMTRWSPVPLVRDGNGFALWLPLSPGRYEYRLEIRNGSAITTLVPEGVEHVDDGFGGENAVVRVP